MNADNNIGINNKYLLLENRVVILKGPEAFFIVVPGILKRYYPFDFDRFYIYI